MDGRNVLATIRPAGLLDRPPTRFTIARSVPVSSFGVTGPPFLGVDPGDRTPAGLLDGWTHRPQAAKRPEKTRKTLVLP